MTILGIDPGSQHFGLSLLEKEGNRVRFVESRLLRLGTGDLLTRMADLVRQLDIFFDEHGVDQAAIEDGFLGKNVKTVEILARIRGVVITLLIQRRIPVFLYTPRTVKQAVTGYGNADKAQTRKALSIYMGREVEGLTDDESDALSIAYCHFLKG